MHIGDPIGEGRKVERGKLEIHICHSLEHFI